MAGERRTGGAEKSETSTLPRRGPKRLAELVGPAAEKSFAKYGFAETALVSHWSSIVGPTLARYSVPSRLRFPAAAQRGGTLTVVVDGPAAVELQHDAPRILDRLNTFFGYPAVSILRLQQGVLPPPPAAPPAQVKLDAARSQMIADTVAPVSDPALKASLARFGEAVSGAAQRRRRTPR